MGHVLSARRISANPQKVEKVQDWPAPKNAKEVHSFLGLASYYQRFIPKFAQVAHCLHELVGQTSHKIKKTKGQKKEGETIAEPKNDQGKKISIGYQNIKKHSMC